MTSAERKLRDEARDEVAGSDAPPPIGEMRVDVTLDVPSDVRYIERIVSLVASQAAELEFAPRQVKLNLPVALSEALANAMLRGNGEDRSKPVHVRATFDGLDLVLEIVDQGRGFDLEDCTSVDPTLPENLLREDGRGLFLMQRLMDRVERFTRDGNVVRLDAPPLMRELGRVLDAFHAATGCPVSVWSEREDRSLEAVASAPPAALPPDVAALPRAPGHVALVDGATPSFASLVVGPHRAWVVVGPCKGAESYIDFLQPVIAQYLQSVMEVEHAARELAERYEEINLLYTISEILGRTVTLEEAASTILTEVSETVGARRASILVHDRVTDTLQAAAVLGDAIENVPPVAVDDPTSVSARVFRTQHAAVVERDSTVNPAEAAYRRGAMLSVPIMWTTPDGGEPLGVVNLSDRRGGQPFTAGDQKLVAAIATQIGTAIQNTRLVRASLAQQRLVHEMQLAHDLQMKLLPSPSVVAPEAEVSARVVPAESVGGDFYHLFRLGPDRTGVMIGDVSSHGYRAALIMALAMSASAIHAQGTSDPAETLQAILTSLREELSTTEMFITAFYGVIDRAAGTLRYANTGHPHAFLLENGREPERLPALDPPLGMVESAPSAVTRAWTPGESVLFLFTDGISDARNRLDARLGEEAVLRAVKATRSRAPAAISEAVFGVLNEFTGDAPLLDDLTLVVVRS